MKKTKNPTFPLLVALSSILVLYKFITHPTDIYGLISVLVGVIGIVHYYKNGTKYDTFFYFWVYIQVPNIYIINSTGFELPIANSFPNSFLPFHLGVGMELILKGNNHLTLYINLLPIALYFLLKYLNAEKPIGTIISMARLRKGSFPAIPFPVTGKIERLSGRNKFIAIYLIQLDKEIQIKNTYYRYILLEPKDQAIIEPKKNRQICGLRLCEAPDRNYINQQNPFVDWVLVDAF